MASLSGLHLHTASETRELKRFYHSPRIRAGADPNVNLKLTMSLKC